MGCQDLIYRRKPSLVSISHLKRCELISTSTISLYRFFRSKLYWVEISLNWSRLFSIELKNCVFMRNRFSWHLWLGLTPRIIRLRDCKGFVLLPDSAKFYRGAPYFLEGDFKWRRRRRDVGWIEPACAWQWSAPERPGVAAALRNEFTKGRTTPAAERFIQRNYRPKQFRFWHG